MSAIKVEVLAGLLYKSALRIYLTARFISFGHNFSKSFHSAKRSFTAV